MSGWIIALIVIAVIVVIGVWIISMYNSLVGMRNRVGNGWSQIDVLLKQRADLIPNLVETVKGYAGHESSVFTQVTQARAGVMAAASDPNATLEQRAAAEQQLSNAMVNLRATAEAYPDLKANQNFMNLQDQLRQIEDKIAYARQFYNDVVLKYNNRIMQVPTNIIAGMFHFVPAQYFAADEQSRQVPQVNFTGAAPQVRF
ncbi:LemA family protein [Bifidobacterium pseudolongum]|uniref:LemA n=1 Tax=Bifidobacterium pseudolongum subsp. pseudolongum TaxID=31954 RepID=A0A4Q5ABW9_9BIFI|nr:LemA family protein [Bifidobacterium pseudolongum]KFI77402.1 LemA-like protein [Bifidobacterium pseudolongum subsp. pseudolongum]MDY3688991.1 LemA family protein [Bifidobacterium pseudolongum]PKV00431.1 LemA-like protein [Bifidobacterium pseudolongum subsp. pseudolongum]PKV08810.1 LemA-like protein [Bifidobacterium pseudolongum subsp. pseudolongum]RYQ21869.1 LemA [Bifidobacterium pseudolongum subsp. pseudolongum]